MWRQQIHADQIADETITSSDIKNWTLQLIDMSKEVIDAIWWWTWWPDNYSYNYINTDKIIPLYQQMWIWWKIDIDWTLIIEWDLILNI